MTNKSPRALTREIARVIKGRMSSYDVTQGEMALIVGVDQSHLSKMIRGLRPITIDQLDIMCHMLDLELIEVLTNAFTFVEERDWEGEPWITPFVLDGERVSRPVDDEPTQISDDEERVLRKSEVALTARRGKKKSDQ